MELSEDIKRDLAKAKRTFDRTREKKPEKAQKKFDKAVDKLCKKQLARWQKKITGKYGGLPKRGKPGFSDEAAQRIVDQAWAKLRELGDADIRDAMDRYEKQEKSSPRFDVDKKVPSGSGGRTRITAKNEGGRIVQTGSGRILVGDRFITRVKRGDFAVKRVIKTLIHELMGHWDRVGQSVKVDPNLSDDDKNLVRKQKFEKRADTRTDKIWNKLKRTKAFKDFCAELERDAAERAATQKAEIKAAIEKCLEELEGE